MNNLLSKIYFDERSPYGFSSQKKLYQKAKQENPSITWKDVKHWWKTQKVPSRFAQKRRKFERAVFVTGGANQTYGMDLADLASLKRWNQGYKFILVVQDLFSRRLVALIAQKTKTSKETAKNLRLIFEQQTPRKIFTDQGGEFQGLCHNVYKEFGIQFYHTFDSGSKVAITERAIRTIKTKLYRMMAASETNKWIDKLENVLKAFNTSYNRTIGMTPREASLPAKQSEVFFNSVNKKEDKRKEKPFKYKLGSIVRIATEQPFEKGYTGSFSNILYKIYGRERKHGTQLYYLKELLTKEDIKGGFYAEELKQVIIDESNSARVEKIFAIKKENNKEKVQVQFMGEKKRQWKDYDDLIVY